MVLNGVGGRTIAEAKQSMTSNEVYQWAAFRNKRGSLFVGRRIEQGFGNLMAHYTQFKVGSDVEVDAFDFMPHENAPELTFEEQRMKDIKKKSA